MNTHVHLAYAVELFLRGAPRISIGARAISRELSSRVSDQHASFHLFRSPDMPPSISNARRAMHEIDRQTEGQEEVYYGPIVPLAPFKGA